MSEDRFINLKPNEFIYSVSYFPTTLTLDGIPLDIKLEPVCGSFFTLSHAFIEVPHAVKRFVMFWLFRALLETVNSTFDLKEMNTSEKLEACVINT